MTHLFYVTMAYLISAVGIGGLIAWVLMDQSGRRRELAALEQKGIRRRSDPPRRTP